MSNIYEELPCKECLIRPICNQKIKCDLLNQQSIKIIREYLKKNVSGYDGTTLSFGYDFKTDKITIKEEK